MKAMLLAEVDLLWFGGIGNYIKASSENNAEAGDRANDAVRVNGSELRCKIVGEGGTLGLTQRGRIAHADEKTMGTGQYWYPGDDEVQRIVRIGSSLYTLSPDHVFANDETTLKLQGSVDLE
jgi:hypothetical protein